MFDKALAILDWGLVLVGNLSNLLFKVQLKSPPMSIIPSPFSVTWVAILLVIDGQSSFGVYTF